MEDRVPLKPGRMKVAPENGAPEFFATLTRADEPTQEGTPLNKSTLLKDSTALRYGLPTSATPDDVLNSLVLPEVAAAFGLSSDAVPNDLFKLLKDSVLYQSSEKNTYLSDIAVGSQFEFGGATFTKLQENYRGVSGNTLVICETDVSATRWSASSTGVYANEELDTYLTNTYYNSLPQEVKSALVEVDIECYSGNAPTTQVTTIKRKVFAPSAAETVKPSAPSVSDGTFIDGLLQQLKNYMTRHNQNDRFFRTPYDNRDASAMSVGIAVTSLYSYSKTTSRRAFPLMVIKSNTLLKTEIVDEKYSKPNGETVPMVKIETGSYVGTGKSGSSNPNSYTFNNPVDLVLFLYTINGANVNSATVYFFGTINGQIAIHKSLCLTSYQNMVAPFDGTDGGNSWNSYVKISSDGKTFYWYSSTPKAQFNINGYTYKVVGVKF